jgi:hypothetical protein
VSITPKDTFYQVIMNVRKAIEPNPANVRYLINFRAKPEGDYQFFPEDQPD